MGPGAAVDFDSDVRVLRRIVPAKDVREKSESSMRRRLPMPDLWISGTGGKGVGRRSVVVAETSRY